MSQTGQERRIGAVRNISALPPRTDVGADIVELLLRANSGREQMQQHRDYSITSSARAILSPPFKELRAAGCESLRTIAAGLEGRGISAPRGGKWSAVQVARLLEGAALPFDASIDRDCRV
jgi:hypothetical protein